MEQALCLAMVSSYIHPAIFPRDWLVRILEHIDIRDVPAIAATSRYLRDCVPLFLPTLLKRFGRKRDLWARLFVLVEDSDDNAPAIQWFRKAGCRLTREKIKVNGAFQQLIHKAAARGHVRGQI